MAAPLATGTGLDRFHGTAPLFPLPTVALLPQVVQPLHVFEERYRSLTAAALQRQRLIAMAVLQPGWEANYERNDLPLHPTVCLSQIEADQRLPDGRYMLLVRGLLRARIITELPPTAPFRQARLQLLPDVYRTSPTIDRLQRRRELLEVFAQLHPAAVETLERAVLVDGELSLGALCDVLAHAAGLGPVDQLHHLLEVDVETRSDLLLNALRSQLRSAHHSLELAFPPPFSSN